jgi:hypothetical protein
MVRSPEGDTRRWRSSGYSISDSVSRIDTLGDDLRDDTTGKLDAKKVGELFGIKIPAIAGAVGVSRQSLNDNPFSEKAQPVLKQFERVARLRSMPRFEEPADFRKWFKRPLPVFSNKAPTTFAKRVNWRLSQALWTNCLQEILADERYF